MESPGEYLKRERELRKVSLAAIFEATRVPMKCLEAIEADDYDQLPHPTFVKGFIKSYCKVLGLDETDAVLRYEIYLKERATQPEEGKPMPINKKKTVTISKPVQRPSAHEAERQENNNKRNVFILLGVGVALIVLFYLASPRQKPTVAKVETPKQTEVAGNVTPQPAGVNSGATQPQQQIPAAVPSTAADVKAPTAQKSERPVTDVKTVTPVTPVEKAAPKAEKTAFTPVKETAKKEAETKPAVPLKDEKKPASAVAPEVKEAAVKQQASQDRKHTLIIKAKETSWIKAEADGAETYDVVLREGEGVVWKAANDFTVTLGNAGGVEVIFDGKRLPELGASGQVVNLKLPREGGQKAEPAKTQAPAQNAAPANGANTAEPKGGAQ